MLLLAPFDPKNHVSILRGHVEVVGQIIERVRQVSTRFARVVPARSWATPRCHSLPQRIVPRIWASGRLLRSNDLCPRPQPC
jgi:hypothetical protein